MDYKHLNNKIYYKKRNAFSKENKYFKSAFTTNEIFIHSASNINKEIKIILKNRTYLKFLNKYGKCGEKIRNSCRQCLNYQRYLRIKYKNLIKHSKYLQINIPKL